MERYFLLKSEKKVEWLNIHTGILTPNSKGE